MRLSPTFNQIGSYPLLALADAKRKLLADGVPIIDFGVGEPREATPEFIRDALVAAIEPKSRYPQAQGIPELRDAISNWLKRRFDVGVDADTEIVPTLGSKEAIFHLAQLVAGDIVVVTTPGYPVPERGALIANKTVRELPLIAANGFLPDLDSVTNDVWERVSILWLNYPNNPTAVTAPPELYEKAAALARKYDFIVACDEAYSELYFGETPPGSALQVGDLRNLVVFNSLSKRSSMAGYRAGFVAGDSELIAALKRYRPNVGVAPPEFLQHAATAAWSDETHVEQVRNSYRRKRATLLPALERIGLRHIGGDATFFLWLEGKREGAGVATQLLHRGIVIAPGELFGKAGLGYWRLALVPTLAECERSVELMGEIDPETH